MLPLWLPEVSEYLGIPFAAPPTEQLRFEPPKPFRSNKTVIAAKFSPDCPANVRPIDPHHNTVVATTLFKLIGQEDHAFSEDCLTLNIWSKPQSGEKKKAVLVWIHGGGFNVGSSANPANNGARLANENDIILVSFNYRLNIFGFPSVSFMKSRNPGLLGQRLAVEWIRDNIAAFGGDPNRIVLYGDDAGATSVDLYTFAWTKDPIASGFIAQSGTEAIRGGGPYPGFAPVFVKDPKTGREVLDSEVDFALEKNPAALGVEGYPGTCGGFQSTQLLFGKSESPNARMLANRQTYQSRQPAGCIESAAWFRVSTKVGCGGREMGEKTLQCMKETSWKVILEALKPTNGTIPIYGSGEFGPVVDNMTGFPDYATRRKAGNFIKNPVLIGTTENEFGFFASLMHSNTTALPSRPDYFEGSFPRILDMHLNCPALDVVNTRRARGINAWLYRYAGDWPNEDLGTIRRPAWHGSGVSLVFGTTEKVFKVADVEKEKITSLKMRNAWSEFVKDPENGLLKLRWPLYNSKDPSLVLLGKTNSSEIAFARNQYYDAICSGSTKLDYATLLEHTSKYHSPSFDICLSPFLEYIRKFGEKEENLRNIPPEIINCKGDGKIYLV